MNNVVIKNFFNYEELLEINNFIQININNIKLDDPELGRVRLNLGNNLSKNIIDKLNNYAKQHNNNFIFSGCYYVEYNKKYGTPTLYIHTDTTSHTFTLDYQLDANVKWDIVVDGKNYSLQNNDALTINVVDQAHWRPKQIFKDNEYVKMIFFHFKDINNLNPHIKTKQEMDEIRIKWHNIWENNIVN